MTNHVHLLATPLELGSVARMMQAVGRRYVRYVNDSLGRSGTLWEGRYKSSMVDSERYLLACYRYIELNPVRAGMVEAPGDYCWSSYRANALGCCDPLVSPHEAYARIAEGEADRRKHYAELVAQGVDEEELASLRLYVQRQRALGSPRFVAQIERQLERRAGLGIPGRPCKKRYSDP